MHWILPLHWLECREYTFQPSARFGAFLDSVCTVTWQNRGMTLAVLGGLDLAGAVGRSLGRVALDAARDRFGGSVLPIAPEQLAQPAVLTELLGSEVRRAASIGVDFESSNCRNCLIDVEYADGTTRSLYAKLPGRELAVRTFANAVGFWELEYIFCARIAEHVPVRVPKVYAAAHRNSRFVLLLENLCEVPGSKLFLNRDMAAGTTAEQARRCISTFAEMHAGFHGWNPARRAALLPMRFHPYLATRQRARTQALNRAAISRARQRAPELVTAKHAEMVRRAFDHWDLLLDEWYRGPLTLVHGDSHLANCFEYATPDGPRVGLLDFQAVHWSNGIRDIAYFLIHSLDSELLNECESELIDHYISEMTTRGVALDTATTHTQYRGFAFQPLMVGLVAIGLGGFTETDATMRTMLRRELAAVDRLDVAEWINSTIAQPTR